MSTNKLKPTKRCNICDKNKVLLIDNMGVSNPLYEDAAYTCTCHQQKVDKQVQLNPNIYRVRCNNCDKHQVIDEELSIPLYDDDNYTCTCHQQKIEINDPINPSHYKQGNIEFIDGIQASLSSEEYKGFLKGQVLKYIWRESHKHGKEDLEKAEWYLNRLINLEDLK